MQNINDLVHIEKEFTHRGYTCLVCFVNSGHRTGYVGVKEGHPYYGKNLWDITASVHGGVSFAEDGEEGFPRKEHVWWIGFDCNHGLDAKDFDLGIALFPHMREHLTEIRDIEEQYAFRSNLKQNIRNTEYVEQECIRLAEQLWIIAKGAEGAL